MIKMITLDLNTATRMELTTRLTLNCCQAPWQKSHFWKSYHIAYAAAGQRSCWLLKVLGIMEPTLSFYCTRRASDLCWTCQKNIDSSFNTMMIPVSLGQFILRPPRKCGLFRICCEAILRQVNFLIDKQVLTEKVQKPQYHTFANFFKHHSLGETSAQIHAHNCWFLLLLLVFTYHVIKPKNRNHSKKKVTNKGYDRKNEWFLRWESTMWARKNDEKEPLELDNWRHW